MSINDLLDRRVDWRCTVCGNRPPCRCWVKIVCTNCRKEQTHERFPEAGELDVIEITCPDCKGSNKTKRFRK